MSHISRIKTQMAEQEYLLQALDDLGYTYDEVRRHGAIRVHTPSRVYSITFRKSGNTYECVADRDGIRHSVQRVFLQQVTQRYAYHATRAKLEKQGFSLVEENAQEGNHIHLRLRRMV